MTGIADSAENAGAHVVEHQTGNTAKVNFKIRCRLTDDVVRRTHHAEHVRCNEDAENSKDNREKNVITSVVLTVRLTFSSAFAP